MAPTPNFISVCPNPSASLPPSVACSKAGNALFGSKMHLPNLRYDMDMQRVQQGSVHA
jgi:hypothetical protein